MFWPIKTIGETCNLMTGGTPSKSKPEYFDGGEIKWLVSGDIHKKEIFDCDGRITEVGLSNSSAKYLPKDSVMIALNGQGKTRGTVALLRTEATCNQSLVSIYPKDSNELIPEFLFIYLHGRYEQIRKMTGDGGNDRRGLNMPLIRSIEIPIPPIPEQKRIVAILDQAFADIEQARCKTEQNLKNARELFESYLQQVFSQRGEGWNEINLGDVADVSTGGTPLKSKNEFWDGDIPWYSSGELNDTFTIEPKNCITAAGLDGSNAKIFPEGSLLVGMYDTAALKMSILDRDGAFNQAIAGVKPNKKINLEFILHSINSIKPELLKLRRGVRQKNLNQSKIKGIPIRLPSLIEQNQVVDELRLIKINTDNLAVIYTRKLNNLDELKKSILQKAFSGELTKTFESKVNKGAVA